MPDKYLGVKRNPRNETVSEVLNQVVVRENDPVFQPKVFCF